MNPCRVYMANLTDIAATGVMSDHCSSRCPTQVLRLHQNAVRRGNTPPLRAENTIYGQTGLELGLLLIRVQVSETLRETLGSMHCRHSCVLPSVRGPPPVIVTPWAVMPLHQHVSQPMNFGRHETMAQHVSESAPRAPSVGFDTFHSPERSV
jgi:hypothetical protein